MMFYKNTKVMIHLFDEELDFFDIVAVVLQGEILALYSFIHCLDYLLHVHRSNKRSHFKQSKRQIICSRNYNGRRRCR